MFFFVLQFDEDIEDIDGISLAKLHRESIPSSFNFANNVYLSCFLEKSTFTNFYSQYKIFHFIIKNIF